MFNGAMTLVPLQQHPHFTNALQAAGINAFSCDDGTQIVQKGPLVFGTGVGDRTDLRALRCTKNCGICVINTDAATHRPAGFRLIMTPANVAEIDLTAPLELHVKARNALRKAQNGPLGTRHRPFHAHRNNWLFAADTAQQKSRNFRAMPHAIAQMWPAEDTLFSVATLRGLPVAAMLFLRHGNAATYQIGWTDAQGRSHQAHQRLLFEACELLAKSGVQRLDLGLVDTVNAQPLARFKLRSGAKLRQLGGTWIGLRTWRR